MYVIYTDYSIFSKPHKYDIDQSIQDIKNGNINIKIEGYLQDFLGTNIDSREYGLIHLTKPNLINKIFEGIKMGKPRSQN